MAKVTQDSGAVEYLASFDKPISLAVMTKLSQWQFQQELSYNAQLGYIAKDFMGLQDTYDQLNVYSSTSAILKVAFSAIQATVKLNVNVNKNLYVDPTLGKVGVLFRSIPNYSKVFVSSTDTDQGTNGI